MSLWLEMSKLYKNELKMLGNVTEKIITYV